jgi:hypothetical protein
MEIAIEMGIFKCKKYILRCFLFCCFTGFVDFGMNLILPRYLFNADVIVSIYQAASHGD